MNKKKLIYFSFLFSFLLAFTLSFTASNVSAADFRVASSKGNVHVEESEEIKNLYTAGNIIIIDADIEKGLHIAGNVVTINGDVGNSVYGGAGTLVINGDVNASVHAAGGSIIINSNILDDLFLASGNVVISKSASVGGDLFVAGSNLDIKGKVLGNVYLGGEIIVINGEINGNVKIVKADKIELGSNARINGNLEYNSKSEIEIKEGAVVLGEITIFSKSGGGKAYDKGTLLSLLFVIISIALLAKVGGLIVVGLVLLYFFKKITENVVKEGYVDFWKSLGIGFLVLIVTPVAGIALLFSIVGIWSAIMLGVLYAISVMLAISFASILFGIFVIRTIKKNKHYPINWIVVVGGVILLTIIEIIPFIGGIVFSLFMIASLGAISRVVYKAVK